jgi:hypothetical protein
MILRNVVYNHNYMAIRTTWPYSPTFVPFIVQLSRDGAIFRQKDCVWSHVASAPRTDRPSSLCNRSEQIATGASHAAFWTAVRKNSTHSNFTKGLNIRVEKRNRMHERSITEHLYCPIHVCLRLWLSYKSGQPCFIISLHDKYIRLFFSAETAFFLCLDWMCVCVFINFHCGCQCDLE